MVPTLWYNNNKKVGVPMDNGRLLIQILILISLTVQGLYSFLIKCRDKNFYSEPKLLGLLSTCMGFLIILYDYSEIWEFGTDSDTNTAIILLGILILILISVSIKGLFSANTYTVSNIDKNDLERILFETFDNYGLACRIDEKNPQTMITTILLDEYDASAEITQKGSSGKNFIIAFKKFSQIYCREDILLDIKEKVNQTTKAKPYRGVGDLVSILVLIAFAAWVFSFTNRSSLLY